MAALPQQQWDEIFDHLSYAFHRRAQGRVGIPDWDSHEMKQWSRHFIYVLGYNPRANPQGHVERLDHSRRRIIATFFHNDTVFHVVNVHSRPGSTPEDFYRRMDREIRDKDEDDLLWFYFRGFACGTNMAYKWRIPNIEEPINAFRFITRMHECPSDIAWLFDCETYCRWTPKLRRRHPMVEIIIAGPRKRDWNDRVVDSDGEYFKSLPRILRNTMGGPDVFGTTGFDLRAQSVPELMYVDRIVTNDVTREWDKVTSHASTEPIWRTKFDKVLAWKDGLWESFGMYIQPKLEFPPPFDPVPQPGDIEVPGWVYGNDSDESEPEDVDVDVDVDVNVNVGDMEDEGVDVGLQQPAAVEEGDGDEDEGIQADMEDGPSGRGGSDEDGDIDMDDEDEGVSISV